MGAAVEVTLRLHAVADDLNTAMFTGRGEGVDGALEAVEGVRVATGQSNFESLVVLVTTDFTLSHLHPFLRSISLGLLIYYPHYRQDKRHRIVLGKDPTWSIGDNESLIG